MPTYIHTYIHHLLPTVYTACLKSLTSCAASIESPYAVDIVRSASRSGSLDMRDARASARACVVITIPVELKGFVHDSLPKFSVSCGVDPGLLLRVSFRPVEGMWVHVGVRPIFQREGERLRANGYRRWVAPCRPLARFRRFHTPSPPRGSALSSLQTSHAGRAYPLVHG